MGNIDVVIVFGSIALMVFMLFKEYLRPGLILFSIVVLFLCTGILTPEEALAGFANRGMVTVALLFLVSEGVRRSDSLAPIMQRIFPNKHHSSIEQGYLRMLPTVATISAFMNNTPIVVIFIPQIKSWCRRAGLPLKKFLIPLSYAAILGGMCTLIGTSTNLVVHSMMIDAGLEGFSMFELGKVGAIITVSGILYILLFGAKRLPNEEYDEQKNSHIVEVVLASRFPGIRCSTEEFDFKQHYGAEIISIRRDGEVIENIDDYRFKENDTLTLSAERNFVDMWSHSRVFLIITNGTDHTQSEPLWRRIVALLLFIVMIIGATLSELPALQSIMGNSGMLLWAAVVAVVMALCNIFPAKMYTKYISWDILVTIASAFAISRAMALSGVADIVASAIISLSGTLSPYIILALVYITTNIITELITNNAAAAFCLPIALSAADILGVNPMPFCVATAIAASASFCTPIGYQTNTIVQGLGRYTFADFIRIGLPLSILTFIISMIFIPIFWSF